MPENTVTAPLAPMERGDVVDTFAYIRALQADDIDMACAVANDTGPELPQQFMIDVAGAVEVVVPAGIGEDEGADAFLDGDSAAAVFGFVRAGPAAAFAAEEEAGDG